MTRVDREWIEELDCTTAEIVAADAAKDGGVVAKPRGHHREIGRRASQLRTSRQDIPQQLPNTKNQMRLFQSLSPRRPLYEEDNQLLSSRRAISSMSQRNNSSAAKVGEGLDCAGSQDDNRGGSQSKATTKAEVEAH
jgi:hypothetical protein